MRRRVRVRVEHVADWRQEPMAFWVHVGVAGSHWQASPRYEPPAPPPEGRRGYRVLCVESQGFEFRFSSAAQLAACIEVLARQPLPTSRRLSALRGAAHGPNSHWLSRLPGRVKSPKARARVVEDLRAVVAALPAGDPFRPAS